MLSIEIVQYAIAVHQTLALMCGVFMYGQFTWATTCSAQPCAVGHCLEKL